MNTIKVLSFLCCLIPAYAIAQSAYQDVREGNEQFKSTNYTEAENKYREGVRKDGELVEPAYNLGNALYRQGKFEDAGRYYLQAANKATDKKQKAKAYHNLGNSLIKTQKLEEGIKAYKNALINNPKDEESRYNLAYAQQQLQQEQQQDENKEENKEEEQQEKEDQQNKEDEQEKEEEEQQQQDQQEEEQQKNQEQQQQQEQQVSREDAERILEALNNKEKELQEKLKKQKVKEVNVNIEKDW